MHHIMLVASNSASMSHLTRPQRCHRVCRFRVRNFETELTFDKLETDEASGLGTPLVRSVDLPRRLLMWDHSYVQASSSCRLRT